MTEGSGVDELHWYELARELGRAEVNGTWHGSASSFSSYLQQQAAKLGVQPSTLWRAGSALKFYNELRPDFDGLQIPPIQELANVPPPEHLELLEKISRVAPRDVIKGLVERMLEGELTRGDLRRRWSVYRDRLEPGTRRGRRSAGTSRPAIPPSPPNSMEAAETEGLLLLSHSDGAWLNGGLSPASYTVFLNAAPQPGKLEFDALLVTRDQPMSDVFIHSVEVKSARAITERTVEQLMRQAHQTDATWLLVLGKKSEQELSAIIPESIGLIEIRNNRLHVVRPAKTRQNPASGLIAKQVLSQMKT